MSWHTPGPWTADWDDSGQWYVNIGGLSVSGNALRGDSGECVESSNAHLIAAAPDLVEALKKAVYELNTIRARDGVPYTHDGWRSSVDEGYFSSVVDESFAAIAKAEGRA